MTILEDIGNKENHHIAKHLYWESMGIYWERAPLPCGDYILANDKVLDVIARKQKRGIEVKKMDFLGTYNVCVDTKKDMQEICGNICGSQHDRFRDECILAKNNGIKLHVLIENEEGIAFLDDVRNWHNHRIDRYEKIKEMHERGRWKNIKLPKAPPTDGIRLSKAMHTMEEKYGVVFEFCNPDHAGSEVVRILACI